MKNKKLWEQDIEAMSIMNKKIDELYKIIEIKDKEIKKLKSKKSIFKRFLKIFKGI
jgi:hypothetical protein